MSVTKIQRTKSVGAATVYAVYGTYENMRNDDVRAAAYSVVSATPDATPKQFITETVAEIARHPKRENQAELIIQSFHPDELDKDNPFDVQLAHLAGMELARRIAPNSDVVVATHIDSESGHIHNHIIIANHDRVTGKTPRNARNFYAVANVNDAVMRDLGLEVYAPDPGQPQGQSQRNLRGAPLPEITKENWRSEMSQRVDAVFADPRVAAAPTVSDGLEVAQDIAAEYSVSFRVTTHKKENRDDVTATSYALVDEAGEEIRYATSRGSRSTKRTGSRLGKDKYTLDAVQQRIEQLQQQYQRQLIQQQQIRTQQEHYHAQEAQEEPTATPADQAVGAAGADGAPSLRERYSEIFADTSNDTATAAAETAADTVHDSGAGRAVGDEREPGGAGRSGEDERDLRQRRSRREEGARAGRSRGEAQRDAQQAGGRQQQPTERSSAAAAGSSSPRHTSTPASWSPDSSVEDMRQVDFDFLEQRVMDDEFRQFQRSEFDGTDKQFFEHLLADDKVVAVDHKNYAHARTKLFQPVGGNRDYFLRTVGENRRLAAARQRQQRQWQQQQQQHQVDTPDPDTPDPD